MQEEDIERALERSREFAMLAWICQPPGSLAGGSATGGVWYSVAYLPDPVLEAGGRLMRALRLRFGALDLIVSPDDEYWFLEVNANGQWAWIEDATGLPIAASIADALQRG